MHRPETFRATLLYRRGPLEESLLEAWQQRGVRGLVREVRGAAVHKSHRAVLAHEEADGRIDEVSSKAADLGGKARGFCHKCPNGRLDALSSLKEGVAGKFARGPKREAHVCRRAEINSIYETHDGSAIPTLADIGIFS